MIILRPGLTTTLKALAETEVYNLEAPMRISYCHEVLVRFINPAIHSTIITLNNGPTASQYLRIENDSVTITIKFCDKDDDVLREINYNFNEIREYDCKGWVRPRDETPVSDDSPKPLLVPRCTYGCTYYSLDPAALCTTCRLPRK